MRPSTADLQIIQDIVNLTSQSRSDVIRSAVAIARSFVCRPFVLAKPGYVHQLRVVPPPISLDDNDRKSRVPVQVRKDAEIENHLQTLLASRRFGPNVSAIIRTSLIFCWEVVQAERDGMACHYEAPNGSLTPAHILEDLGVRIRRPAPTRLVFFNTKPCPVRGFFRTTPV